jgi:hypothetical protein
VKTLASIYSSFIITVFEHQPSITLFPLEDKSGYYVSFVEQTLLSLDIVIKFSVMWQVNSVSQSESDFKLSNVII